MGDRIAKTERQEPARPARGRVRPYLVASLFLVTVWLGEMRVLHRVWDADPAQRSFVARSVDGVLGAAPAFEAWRHRFLAPALVSAVDRLTRDRLQSIDVVCGLTLLAANLVLFGLVRRRGGTAISAGLAVTGFALCRVLLVYKLEYPWDGIAILLFLIFGEAARAGHGLWRVSPLVALGVFTHEAVLYLPLWYVLAPLDPEVPRPRAQALGGGAALGALAGLIVALRYGLSGGHGSLASPSESEPATPVIGNPIHLAHNLRQLVENFGHHRAFVSIAVLGSVALLFAEGLAGRYRRAAAWSVLVILTVFVFGYINETRLYLVLVAFWFAYAWPATRTGRTPPVPAR